jgi:hypothetical protein
MFEACSFEAWWIFYKLFKIPASFPVTEVWSSILRDKHKYHVPLDKLYVIEFCTCRE